MGIYPLGHEPLASAGYPSDDARLILLRDWGPMQAFIDELRLQIVRGGLAVLGLALVGSVVFSSRVTRPLRDVARAAERLTAGDWSEVPVRGGAEAATMAAAFNAMGRRLRDTCERLEERTRTLEVEAQERQRAEHTLMVAAAVAERASVAKSAFLANLSHELRTPLNAILGFSELLREEAKERGLVEYLPDIERIESAGRQLHTLISGVLDLSRIEAGCMALEVEAFDAGALVRAVLDAMQPLAREHGNALTADGLDLLGTIRSDRAKLKQVLLNVVGNACKFTSEGRVRVEARRATAHEDTIILNVCDTGIGMTREQTARLFRDYAQGDVSMARRHGGAGLGLAISARLCRLLGGTISVKSEPGVGSTFTITVPADASADDGGKAAEGRQSAPSA
jgi:signal transduction histidine kinase